MECAVCGAENPAGARFCNQCGKDPTGYGAQRTVTSAPPPMAPPMGQNIAQPAGPTTVVVKRGHGCLWAALIVIGVIVAGAVIVGLAINKAADELNAEQARHAITQEQFDAIPLGMARAEVVTTLGKEPEDAQEFVTKGVFTQDELRSSCIYYNKVGGSFGDRYQFCFNGDALNSKNSY